MRKLMALLTLVPTTGAVAALSIKMRGTPDGWFLFGVGLVLFAAVWWALFVLADECEPLFSGVLQLRIVYRLTVGSLLLAAVAIGMWGVGQAFVALLVGTMRH